MGDLH